MPKSDCLILLGPPNSGKTTLFNWITGYRRKTVNYPGSTADLAFGKTKTGKPTWTVVDTPGLYSLFSSSPEAEITKKILSPSTSKAIVLVLDSTRLKRQLPLLFQIQSAGWPVVVALTMYDIQKKSASLDMRQLSGLLKVPVCPIEGLLGGGVPELLKTARSHFNKTCFEQAAALGGFSASKVGMKQEHSNKANITLSRPISSVKWSENKQSAYLKKATKIVDKIGIKKEKTSIGRRTKIWDSFLLHPLFGFVFLLVILFTFFSSLFWLAKPFMEGVDKGIGWGVTALLNSDPSKGLWMDFLANGVLTGFGSFLIFIPQIFILFLGLYLLEDSGYMARAVSLLDGPFSRIGLSGKSLFPFLSGFACAIPAILSARAISSKRERWITIFVMPFMTCSARLPVYALLLGFVFYGDSTWKPGLGMSVLYFLSLLLGVVAAGLLNLFIPIDKKSSFFIELPLYRRPVLKSVLSVSWSRTKHFISKAGPVIFVFSLLMWVATNYPRPVGGVSADSSSVSESTGIEQSYAGRFGQTIEPVFEKMGGDWRVGVSLLSAFVAREVFVSVLAVTLKNTQNQTLKTSDNQKNTGLVQVMKQTQQTGGTPLFSKASIWALLVFFVFSLQCLSTTAVVYKETGSWKWAGAQLVGFNLLAYVSAVLTYTALA